MGAFSNRFITAAFQQLGYSAAVVAFIFVYWHQNLVSIVNLVRKGFYVMIMRGKYQYQSLWADILKRRVIV
jgi:hypothetical protein